MVLFSRSVVSDFETPLDCRSPGFPVLHNLLELAQTHVYQVSDAIQPSHPLLSPSAFQSFPASGSFLMSRLFALGGQSIGASASASVLPMNIQDLFPLGWGSLISSQESSPTPQFKSINSSALGFLYSPTFTSIHDYWKYHNLD